MNRRIKILLVAVTPPAIVALAFFYWSSRFLPERRYLWEQGKGTAAILFSEGSILLIHLVIYLGATVGLLLLHRFKEERAFQIYSILLVVMVLGWSTWNLAKASRSLAAQEAERMCDDTVLYAQDQLNRSPSTTSDVVILDQAIARIVSYIHTIVRNDFPEFKLRTVSLHMLAGNTAGQEVWNVIQEGVQAKDGVFLPTESLVGLTIKDKRSRYCENVMQTAQGGADCRDFKSFPDWQPGYKSLVCYPLKGGGSAKDVFAGLCFDSEQDRAFDSQTGELERRVKKQMYQLNQLLLLYRKQEKLFFQNS